MLLSRNTKRKASVNISHLFFFFLNVLKVTFSRARDDPHSSKVLDLLSLIQRSQSVNVPPLVLYHSVPLPSHRLTLFVRRGQITLSSEPFLKCYLPFIDISSVPTRSCDDNGAQVSLAFSITRSTQMITGLKIEKCVDCDGIKPSGLSHLLSKNGFDGY